MGGFFGSVKKSSALFDVFIGTDYHSHLGTKRGGMAAYDKALGLQREIHNIENAPFRTKFERVLGEMKGNAAIGCISDTDPQPLLMVSKVGTYAICTVGVINNAEKLMNVIRKHTALEELTPTLLREFVEKIVVHEATAADGRMHGNLRRQEIEIYYSFVGKVDLPE